MRQAGALAVRILRRDPHGERPVGPRLGNRATRLDRRGDEAGELETLAHDMGRGRKRLVDAVRPPREAQQRLGRTTR